MTSGTDLGKSDMDYAAHEETYLRFTGMVKNGTITLIVILVLLAYFTL